MNCHANVRIVSYRNVSKDQRRFFPGTELHFKARNSKHASDVTTQTADDFPRAGVSKTLL